eukprot:Sspe_Gene.8035::Locus_2732_Transcript_1_1_Confidence_1.000_Length_2139::g.8035::m.8035/K00485/FMO; dimethylaniline monooxygenase (N-oxide forming)
MNNDYDSNRLRYSLPKSLHNGTAYLCALLNYICGTMSECSAKRFELLRKSRKGAFSQFATKSDHFIPYLVSGDLTLRPGIKEFNGSSVTFEDGTVFENIDCMLLCTGYGGPAGRMFSYFDQDLLGCGCVSKMYKYMFIPHHGSDMVFMGFARPHIGSIPPIAELQARYFAQLVSGTKELPTIKAMEKDIQAACASWERDFGGRLKTMVNWIPYSDALADAIGCRPPASLWITDPALALKLVTGPFTNFHFRLAGPDACPEETRKVIMSLPVRDAEARHALVWIASPCDGVPPDGRSHLRHPHCLQRVLTFYYSQVITPPHPFLSPRYWGGGSREQCPPLLFFGFSFFFFNPPFPPFLSPSFPLFPP